MRRVAKVPLGFSAENQSVRQPPNLNQLWTYWSNGGFSILTLRNVRCLWWLMKMNRLRRGMDGRSPTRLCAKFAFTRYPQKTRPLRPSKYLLEQITVCSRCVWWPLTMARLFWACGTPCMDGKFYSRMSKTFVNLIYSQQISIPRYLLLLLSRVHQYLMISVKILFGSKKLRCDWLYDV